jgi:hypothetical protein
MTRDEQARAIAAAAIDHVVANGQCDNLPDDHDPEYDGYYCDDNGCTYCALVRAMEGYDAEG